MATGLGPDPFKDGQFVRPESSFRSWISAEPGAQYPPAAGRYALYVTPGCPWAHRTLIVRHLKGLVDLIDVYQVHHELGPDGWVFNGRDGSLDRDPLHGFTQLKQLYRHADPAFVGRYTVPVLWDKQTDTLVNNESSEIIQMLASAFDALLPPSLQEAHRPGGGLYPAAQRPAIDALNDWVYHAVNNGVYKTGFAKTQASYDEHVAVLFAGLDRLEHDVLAHGRPYLLGDHLTLADVRLFTTLARFDVAYYTIFLCNLRSIRHDYPRLHLWLRRLYWDRDPDGPARGAFYATTAPYAHLYKAGYAMGRRRLVLGEGAPLIVPAGPAVPIEPL